MVNSNVNNTGNASNAFSTNHPSANAANAANPNPNSKKRLAEAMDPGGNNRDALHPNKRLMTQTSDSAVLPPGTFFSVDTQSDYTVRCVQGAAPTFEFKASGPAKVHFDMGYSGVPAIAAFGAAPWAPVGAAAQVSDPMPAQASCAPGAVAAPGVVSAPGASFTIQAPGATAGAVQVGPRVPPAGALTPVSGAVPAQEPGTLAASGVLGVLNAPGGPVATSGGQAEAPGAANGVFTAPSGAHAAPAYVVPANARPPPAVVAFARRASNASPDVDNAKPRTGWEEMGFREDSIPSSENTRSDSDVA
ncbi:hypothetical protein QBC32DRAFT_373767 [Pseudoneurospora amorphoporcata]|uniref:Uncharacterized protein n=1 Tax=Pseudoneurospora amorphoporcata TaxID=241081 RepID=A0AAN6NNA9_9PEZI|nr:hypothetical protein QBC32DRAFT_373767 [Pseudoneurospora amorphoporcata]